jgi:hypothetical protein
MAAHGETSVSSIAGKDEADDGSRMSKKMTRRDGTPSSSGGSDSSSDSSGSSSGSYSDSSDSEDASDGIDVSNHLILPLLTCGVCDGIFRDPHAICQCMHTCESRL